MPRELSDNIPASSRSRRATKHEDGSSLRAIITALLGAGAGAAVAYAMARSRDERTSAPMSIRTIFRKRDAAPVRDYKESSEVFEYPVRSSRRKEPRVVETMVSSNDSRPTSRREHNRHRKSTAYPELEHGIPTRTVVQTHLHKVSVSGAPKTTSLPSRSRNQASRARSPPRGQSPPPPYSFHTHRPSPAHHDSTSRRHSSRKTQTQSTTRSASASRSHHHSSKPVPPPITSVTTRPVVPAPSDLDASNLAKLDGPIVPDDSISQVSTNDGSDGERNRERDRRDRDQRTRRIIVTKREGERGGEQRPYHRHRHHRY